MTYAVKECFLTLQGEGVQTGRRATFLRFAGCNLWSGREQDRAANAVRVGHEGRDVVERGLNPGYLVAGLR